MVKDEKSRQIDRRRKKVKVKLQSSDKETDVEEWLRDQNLEKETDVVEWQRDTNYICRRTIKIDKETDVDEQ
jgi:hypothetical protein